MADTLETRFWANVQKTDTCWLWTGAKFKSGYGQIGTCEKPNKTLRVHRLSWEIHFGPIPQNLKVLHRCDVPLCVRPDHLFLGTNRDNSQDALAKGRLKTQRILTADEVQQIRTLYESQRHYPRNISRPYSLRNLAAMFHVTYGEIGHIVNRRIYKRTR